MDWLGRMRGELDKVSGTNPEKQGLKHEAANANPPHHFSLRD